MRFALVVLSGLRTIALACVAGLALALLAVAAQPRSFEATSQALVWTGNPTTIEGLNLSNSFTQQAVANYARIATTPFVLDRVRSSLGLTESAADLAERVAVTTAPDTSVLAITADAPTPAAAARLANAVTAALGEAVDSLPQASGGVQISFTQVEPARAPDRAATPNPPLYVALGLALGLVAGLAVVLLRELFSTRIRSAADVEAALGAPALGDVPAATADGAALVVAPGVTDPRAEAYRALRTNVLRRIEQTGERVFVVSAADPGAAATGTAANLALALADAGRSVLLVDADLRRRGIAQLFGMQDAAGLSEVLRGAADLRAVLQHRDGGPDVLTAGAPSGSPSELLQSEAMADALHDLRRRYDAVVVDAPALAPLTDAALLTAVAAGALVVVTKDRTTRRAALAGRHAVELAGGRVLGAVVHRPVRGGVPQPIGPRIVRAVAPLRGVLTPRNG